MGVPGHLIPPATIAGLTAILRRCSLVITNDSGPMHIAAAVGAPVVAVFGPTDPRLQGPYNTPHAVVRNQKLLCLGCNYTSCPIGNPCMEELLPEQVFETAVNFVTHNRLLERERVTR